MRPLREYETCASPPDGWIRPGAAAGAWGVTEEAVHSGIRRGVVRAVRVWEGKVPKTYVAPGRPVDGRTR